MTDKRIRQTYSREHADELRRILGEASNETPRRQRHMSMRDLIGDLKEDIGTLRQRGYTIDEICLLITAEDEFRSIAQSTLRRYVSAATGKRRSRRRRAEGRARSTTPTPDTGARADTAIAGPDQPPTPGTQRRGEFAPDPDLEDL